MDRIAQYKQRADADDNQNEDFFEGHFSLQPKRFLKYNVVHEFNLF